MSDGILFFTGAMIGILFGGALATLIATRETEKEGAKKAKKWIKKMKVINGEKFKAYDPKWHCPSCGKEYDPSVVQLAGIKFCYECGERVEE